MLGERITLDVNIKDNKYILSFNLKAIKNLFLLTNRNAFEVVNEFVNGDDTNFYNIVLAMSDLNISVEDLIYMTDDNKDITKQALINLISAEILSEVESDEENNVEHINKEIDTKQTFLDWWNYHYYMCIYNLRIDEDKFYKMTVREVKTICELHRAEGVNTLLGAYVKVIKSNKNDSVKQNNKLEANAKNGVRIKDLLLNR